MVRIAVCVAQVGVLADDVELARGVAAVDPSDLDLAVNEWDTYAIEEAVRQRDAHGGEVVAVTVGGASADAVLRRALAMGVDRAVRVEPASAGAGQDALALGASLAVILRVEAPDLVLCGMQTSDGGAAATGPATAAFLELPVETCVIRLAWDPQTRTAEVRRELDGGAIEVREVVTPAVLAIQSGINEPRYATFRAIKQAEQREITVVAGEVGRPGATVRGLALPDAAGRAEMLAGSPAAVAERITAIIKERVAR